MSEPNKMNRNKFLKIAGGLAIIPAGYLLYKMAEVSSAVPKRTIEAKNNFENGVIFNEDYILVKNNGKIKVFSPVCTHMRCNIITQRDGLLVCPCHGSRFDMDGNVVKGPATRNLDELTFSVKNDKIIIEIGTD